MAFLNVCFFHQVMCSLSTSSEKVFDCLGKCQSISCLVCIDFHQDIVRYPGGYLRLSDSCLFASYVLHRPFCSFCSSFPGCPDTWDSIIANIVIRFKCLCAYCAKCSFLLKCVCTEIVVPLVSCQLQSVIISWGRFPF